MDISPTNPTSLLDELDAKQDAVIAQLDQLNGDIERVLNSLSSDPQPLEDAA
jgi:hypothetical protein|tara:strand:+ start:213 stop:368 length:156 start_codon:yes stop_codon:yes gene_type:complete